MSIEAAILLVVIKVLMVIITVGIIDAALEDENE